MNALNTQVCVPYYLLSAQLEEGVRHVLWQATAIQAAPSISSPAPLKAVFCYSKKDLI